MPAGGNCISGSAHPTQPFWGHPPLLSSHTTASLLLSSLLSPCAKKWPPNPARRLETKSKSRVIRHFYSALLWDEPIARDAQIWPVIASGSHSFTCQPLMNHTCLYSPAAGHHCPLAGAHCTYPRRDGQAELTWVTGDRVL